MLKMAKYTEKQTEKKNIEWSQTKDRRKEVRRV